MRYDDPNPTVAETVIHERLRSFCGVALALIIRHNSIRNLDSTVRSGWTFETTAPDNQAAGQMHQGKTMRPRIG